MKKTILLWMVVLLSMHAAGHNLKYGNPVLRKWTTTENTSVMASYVVENENAVLLEDAAGTVQWLNKSELSPTDSRWLNERREWIKGINTVRERKLAVQEESQLPVVCAVVLLFVLLVALLYRLSSSRSVVWYARFVFLVIVLSAFGYWKDQPLELQTDPATIDQAFQPFVPAVHTFYDNNYFYVESRGIPETHEMMVGISNHGWQQQVPIPQCYIGNNAWPIPLNPVMAVEPIPVDDVHFTRGAIAIAANGVPIFNVHTNTGVDSYLDGQLDNFGVHCGRADEYHNHIAPLHLYDYTDTSLPIAYGLDGFAVYGSLEPDGSPMLPLDANHGHFGPDGIYHYHGTAEAPYMIARMAGEVTEDSTHQLIPQAAAHPVRPSLTPLNGALINFCVPNNAGNGYSLGYILNGQQDSIVYSWTNNGLYTFHYFTTGDGVANTIEYNGFDQCMVPVHVNESSPLSSALEVFPNPCAHFVQVKIPSNECHEIRLYSSDARCLGVYSIKDLSNGRIDVSNFANGTYYLECITNTSAYVQKVLKQ